MRARIATWIATLITAAPAIAQTATATWLEVREPAAPFVAATTSHVVACPDGGVVAVSIVHQGGSSSPGEASVRKLTENGDIAWEKTRALTYQDYIGLYGRTYIAGLEVGDSGEVLIAYGSAGPLEIELYESDGTLRWERMVPVMAGPHIENPILAVASNGDVVLATTETLYQGGNFSRFGLYRFAASNGAQLWVHGQRPRNFTRMALDPNGDVILAVNRESTGPRDWTIERYDAAGTFTGSALITLSANSARIADVVVDEHGRTIVMVGDWLGASVVALDRTMSELWSTPLPATVYGTITLMADGDAVVSEIGLNWDLVRIDLDTGASHFSPANVVGRSYFGEAVALPNGHCVVALMRLDQADALCLQERDPAGNVVRAHDAPTDYPWGSEALAAGKRGNVYAAYNLFEFQVHDDAGLEKVVFHQEQGTPYCGPAVPNSTGASATIRAVGTLDVPSNNLSLLFADLPPGTTVLPLASRSTGFVMQPGGSQGNLCLGGNIGRFDEPGEIRFADANGAASMQVELTAMPTPGGLVPAMGGETWHFQAWFRDAVPGQPSTSNFTDGVSISLL